MAGKIFIRTLLVAVLVVTAHVIKPFSFGNVTLHALGAARSFSFVMPEAAVERIEYANYLTQAFGKRLFDGDDDHIWTSEDVLRSNLVAFTSEASTLDDAEIRDVKSYEPAKKTAPKRQVRRLKRDDSHDGDSTSARSNEIAELPEAPFFEMVAMLKPVDLPVYQPRATKTTYAPTVITWSRSNSSDCESSEIKTAVQLAFILQSTKRKVELTLMPKPATIISQCRDGEAKEVETGGEIIETTSGPEEEFFAEPAPVAPLAAVPMVQECIRIQ
ncbi:MAG: hypothetical protein AB7P14_19135 [Blastocatellales bacterium]